MKILKTFIAVVGAGAVLSGCATGQPAPGCYIQSHSNWFLKYDRTSASPQCSQAQLDLNRLKGERAGVYKFQTPGQGDARLLIRPTGVASLVSTAPSDDVFLGANAIGDLADEPDASRFCAVGDMNPVTAPQTTPVAGERRYQFRDVKTYAGARMLGLMLTGKLTYSEPGQAAGQTGLCTMEFDVNGAWTGFAPVPCVVGKPINDPNSPLDTCGPGSGAGTDVAWSCVPQSAPNAQGVVTGRCAPAGAIPSYKPGVEEIDYNEDL